MVFFGNYFRVSWWIMDLLQLSMSNINKLYHNNLAIAQVLSLWYWVSVVIGQIFFLVWSELFDGQ